MSRTSFASGKIILSGEYAVLFGRAGIGIPSRTGIEVVFGEDAACDGIEISWDAPPVWLSYAHKVVELCREERGDARGRLTIHATLPLGKGMGSSTALIIAIVRVLIGSEARETALKIENILSPSNSGFDFAVVWQSVPILYKKGEAQPIELPPTLLQNGVLIDTGIPGEPTNELVAWMKNRKSEIQDSLNTIANCTERLACGEPLEIVMREHHAAQVALGVVPPSVQEMIAAIENVGGAAKVIGAGSRSGGAGMVLALGNQEAIHNIAAERNMPTLAL